MRSDIRKIVVITGVMLMTSVVTTFFILNIVITVLTKSYINYIVKMIKRLYLTDTDTRERIKITYRMIRRLLSMWMRYLNSYRL